MKITLMEIAIMSKCRVKMPQHESCLSYILGENSFPLKNKVSCPKKPKNLLASSQLAIMGLETSQDLNFKLGIKTKIEFRPLIENGI